MKTQMKAFMDIVEAKIGNKRQPLYLKDDPEAIYYDLMGDDRDADENVLPYGDKLIDTKTANVNEAYLKSLDTYIWASMILPGRDGIPVLTKVIKRKRDAAGDPVGESNPIPVMDSWIYELQFPDRRIKEYGVKVIGENLHNQLNEDGWDLGLLEEIVEFCRNDEVAIPIKDGFTILSNGEKKLIVTMKGWDAKLR